MLWLNASLCASRREPLCRGGSMLRFSVGSIRISDKRLSEPNLCKGFTAALYLLYYAKVVNEAV